MKKQSGFTLIELSIVLVIIGLITSGVLVGQTLIEQVKMRQTISMAREIETVVNTFKLKYNCLPGDCVLSPYFSGATDGNGNKVVESGSESNNVDDHLAYAGLLMDGIVANGTGIDAVKGIISGVDVPDVSIRLFETSYYTWPEPLSGYALVFYFEPGGGQNINVLQNLDQKFDDGNGFTGLIRATDDDESSPNSCVDLTGSYRNTYSYQGDECAFFISSRI